MITGLSLSNFRAYNETKIELAPITVFTGGNNSGKSSIMYSLMILKNIVSNPNQGLDNFFSFGFLNLGGFKENVFLKQEDTRQIELGIESSHESMESQYGISLGKKKSKFWVKTRKPLSISLALETGFPYALNLPVGQDISGEFGEAKITWNGLSPTVTLVKLNTPEEERARIVQEITSALIVCLEDIRRIDFISLKRGFTKPIYSPVSLPPNLFLEDEVATLLANDRDLEGQVSYYLQKIVGRSFNFRPTSPGVASFYLQTQDRQTSFISDLVNEGFGTNQLVYLLTKCLRQNNSTICIEEPEIHLHPEAVARLVDSLCEITADQRKTFLISTHSEHFLLSLLNRVAQERIDPKNIRAYYIHKDKKESKSEKQEINRKGQIEGGLKAFYDTQMREVQEYLDASQEK